MATSTISVINGFLKRDYIGPIREQLNNSAVLEYRLQKNEEDVSGEDLKGYLTHFHKRNQGIGARSEGGTLPTAGTRTHTRSSVAMAYYYGRVRVSGQAIKASRNSATALAKVVENEVKGMTEGLKIEFNRSNWGDGSGYLAKITQATGSITAENFFTVDNAQRMEDGMIVDAYTAKSGGSQNLDSKTVSQVDRRNNKISLTTTETVTQNDFLFREDSRGLYGMGIEGIVDGLDSAGTRIVTALQGITRSTNLWFEGNVLDNGGSLRSLTLTLVQQGFELGEIIGQGRCSLIISPYALRNAYLDLMLVDRRYVGKMTLDGGWSALEYSGGGEPVPWVVDYMAKKNNVFFLDESTLARYQASDLDWMDNDGAVLSRVADKDEYDAVAYAYRNLGCTAPNRNSVLRDVQA